EEFRRRVDDEINAMPERLLQVRRSKRAVDRAFGAVLSRQPRQFSNVVAPRSGVGWRLDVDDPCGRIAPQLMLDPAEVVQVPIDDTNADRRDHRIEEFDRRAVKIALSDDAVFVAQAE